MEPLDLTRRLKEKARGLGFELSGAAPTGTPDHFGDFLAWLEKGYAGEMGYLERRKADREDPSRLLPGARSVFCVALSYQPGPAQGPWLEKHPISCYAWGEDYHRVLGERLEVLAQTLRELSPSSSARWYVDTGPLLERSFAARAGLGWIGKNTLLLDRRHGSFLFLGELLTDALLAYDDPVEDLCRTCTACLEACPVGALEEGRVLNAPKCISYLTLEHRSDLPEGTQLHGYLAGCDLCQTACPYNSQAPAGKEPAFLPRPGMAGLTRASAEAMTEPEFEAFTHGSALERVRFPMWKRNLEQGG